MSQTTHLQMVNEPGAAYRQHTNEFMYAILSDNQGASAPSTTVAYMTWLDTSVTPPILRRRNAANNAWDLAENIEPANIRVSGATPRITGDMDNPTEANRVTFQNSKTNASSVPQIAPSGAGTVAGIAAFNSSAIANCGAGTLSISSTAVAIGSSKVGTGTFLPLVLQAGGIDALTIAANGTSASTFGNFTVGTSDQANAQINIGSTSCFLLTTPVDWGILYKPRIAGGNAAHGFLNAAGGAVVSFTNAGDIVANGNVTAYSDETLKTGWKSLGEGFIVKLSNVKMGTYSRIDTEEPLRQVGVSAQSLQEVMPEAVLTRKDGLLSVAYGNAALAACVELAKESVSLRNEVEALRKEVELLKGGK